MRQAKKETIVLQADNRLLHNDMHQSIGLHGAAFTMENAQEWAAGSASVRMSPRRPIR